MAAPEYRQPNEPLTTQYVGPRDPELIRKLVEHTHRRYSDLRKRRQPYWDLWRDISEWLDPTDGEFLWNYNKTEDKARKSHGKILNGWGTLAMNAAANGMQTGLTPRSRPWFEVESTNPEAKGDKPSQEWLHFVQNLLRAVLEGSNFYDQTRTNYPRLLLYGVGPITTRRDPQDTVRFESHEIGSYYLGVDASGRTDTFYKECVYTVGQLADRYEYDALSDTARENLEKGKYDSEVKVIMAIERNRSPFYDPDDLGWRQAPYRRVEVEMNSSDDTRVLTVEPLDVFPVAIPRTKRGLHNPYASTSPGREALGDVKTLQVDELNKGETKEQLTRPTVVAPTALKGKADQLRPDETVYVDVLQGQGGITRAFDQSATGTALASMNEDIIGVQHRLDRHFFRDIFQAITMIERGNVREIEIDARVREQMGQIGPIVENIIPDQNDAILGRVFSILDAMGLIPPAPPLIAGNPLRMNYVSILAQGQKAADIERLDRWLVSAQSVAEFFPGARHRFDADAWMREKATAIGVPPTTIASDQQVLAAAQAEAEALARQQEAEAMATGAAAAKDIAQAGVTAQDLPVEEP